MFYPFGGPKLDTRKKIFLLPWSFSVIGAHCHLSMTFFSCQSLFSVGEKKLLCVYNVMCSLRHFLWRYSLVLPFPNQMYLSKNVFPSPLFWVRPVLLFCNVEKREQQNSQRVLSLWVLLISWYKIVSPSATHTHSKSKLQMIDWLLCVLYENCLVFSTRLTVRLIKPHSMTVSTKVTWT